MAVARQIKAFNERKVSVLRKAGEDLVNSTPS